jgi:hypothetical protein
MTCGQHTEMFNVEVGHVDITAIVSAALYSATINISFADTLWDVC